MCHTMIVGAATVVIAVLVLACIYDDPPDDIHAASASIDVMELTGGEKSGPGR